MKLDLTELKAAINDDAIIRDPRPHNMCSCGSCDGTFRVSTLDYDYEYDDWEHGSGKYIYHLCPFCEDGGEINDYWHSRSAAFVDRVGRWLKKGRELCEKLNPLRR